jgi:hypothetical protein
MSKQLVKSRFDGRIFLRGPSNQIPPQEESALEQLRTFSQWLLISPVVLALIFGVGQLALLFKTEIQFASSNSSHSAEYSPWEFVPVRALRDGIVDEIRNDFVEKVDIGGTFYDPILELDQVWLEGSSGPIIPSTGPLVPSPTDQAESEIIPTFTPQPTQPSSQSPTVVSPQPTHTSIPTPTSTPYPPNDNNMRFPTDDAWIRASQPGSDGVGNHLKLQNPNKIAFLKFNLSGLNCNDTSVTLSLITSLEKEGTVHLHRTEYENWDEVSLDGTHTPSIEDRIGSAVASGAQWEEVSWDVTTYICQTIQDGKPTITFTLLMTEGEQVYFCLKEYREGIFSPKLIFSAPS